MREHVDIYNILPLYSHLHAFRLISCNCGCVTRQIRVTNQLTIYVHLRDNSALSHIYSSVCRLLDVATRIVIIVDACYRSPASSHS